MDWSGSARVCLFAITLCFVSSMPLRASAQQDAQTSLRELVQEFCSRYERKDLEALMSLWSDVSPERTANKERLERVFASKSRITLADRSIRKTEIDGAKAVVRVSADQVTVDAKSTNGSPQQSRTNWSFHCVLED